MSAEIKLANAISAAKILYHGRFTTSSATIPADTVCGGLYGNGQWDGCTIMPLAGADAFQPRKIVTYTGGGAFGVFYLNNPLTALPGLVDYWILEDSFDPAVGVDSPAITCAFHVIGNKGDTAKVIADGTSSVMSYLKGLVPQIAKLTGAAPVVGNTTANWFTAEANVVSVGADNIKNKLLSLSLSIHNLVGTVITVRMYMQINNTERRIYEHPFDATADPLGIVLVDGVWGIHEVVRVSLQSNSAADNGKAVDYDYMLETM